MPGTPTGVSSLDGDGWELKGFLGEGWRWELDRDPATTSPGWMLARVPGSVLDAVHRSGGVPVMRHRGDWWINEPLVQAAFGGGIDDLESLRRASRYLQADGLRVAVEANRRRWPLNTGSLPWQFNESYPNAWSTAAVDHSGRPKPAYHVVREAYAPVVVSASFDTPAIGRASALDLRNWAWSDLDRPVEAALEMTLTEASGRRLADHRLDVSVCRESVTGPFAWTAAIPSEGEDVLVLELRLVVSGRDQPTAQSRYVLTRAPDLSPLRRLRVTELQMDWSGADGEVTVWNAGSTLAFDVALTCTDARADRASLPLTPTSDAFHLMPGERRAVGVPWRDTAPEHRAIVAQAWNAPPAWLRGAR